MFKKYSEEKGELVWKLWVVLLVEFLGTFAMVFQIEAPSSFDLASNKIFGVIFGTNIMKAVWVAGFILLLIFICRKVSVNLNPTVTMAEIAIGNTRFLDGAWMMLFQVMGGLLAGESCYLVANHIGTWHPNITTLDAVAPNLNYEHFFGGVFNITVPEKFNWLKQPPTGALWLYGLVSFFIEAVLTFSLLASICYGKVGHNTRALLIFITLVIIVAIGIPTDNIALNPARLIGPAVSAELNGGAKTLQYTWIFFMGELFAVIIFWYIEALKNDKKGNSLSSIKKQLRIAYSEVLVTKARYGWFKDGNQPLENLSKSELTSQAKILGLNTDKKALKEDIEYSILEHLIFGAENSEEQSVKQVRNKSKRKILKEQEKSKKEYSIKKSASKKEEPLKTGVKTEQTKKPVVKKDQPKKQVVKKEQTKKPAVKKTPVKTPVAKKTTKPVLSNAEKAKRDAKRKALQEKADKAKKGSKILTSEIKKLKLTDLYGVGPKTEAYLIKNEINDLVKLSKKDVNKMTKKFITELPALKSLSSDDKAQKLRDIISEAKYMIEELTK